MLLTVAREAYRGFLRRAKYAYPKEYIEALWGNEAGGAFRVLAFLPMEHEATRSMVEYGEDEWGIDEPTAQARGYTYLGTIHTHPDVTTSEPSETDWRQTPAHDRIEGICSIWKRGGALRSRVVFWPAAWPFKVEWIKR